VQPDRPGQQRLRRRHGDAQRAEGGKRDEGGPGDGPAFLGLLAQAATRGQGQDEQEGQAHGGESQVARQDGLVGARKGARLDRAAKQARHPGGGDDKEPEEQQVLEEAPDHVAVRRSCPGAAPEPPGGQHDADHDQHQKEKGGDHLVPPVQS
jgi:hypothetical protein